MFQEGRIGWALLNVAINMLGSFAMTGIAFWLFFPPAPTNCRSVNVGLIFSVTLVPIQNEGDRMKESLMSAGVVLLSVLIVASFLKMYLLG